MMIVLILAVLWSNAFLLGILLLLFKVRNDLQAVARGMRVDTNIVAASTNEIASAVRNPSGEQPVLAVEETNASA